MDTIAKITTPLARIMISTIFLMSAVGNKIPKFNDVASYMAAEGVPMPKFLLAGAILFLIVGSLSLILGFKARIGAGLLLIFLVLATYYFHDFWTIEDPAAATTANDSLYEKPGAHGYNVVYHQ
ncbi:MAG: DoxX family protein [Planctomycetaceae bacterium]